MDDVGGFTLTGIILIILSICIIIWDFYLYKKSKQTISQAIYKFSKVSIAVPFLVGFIMGHFFW